MLRMFLLCGRIKSVDDTHEMFLNYSVCLCVYQFFAIVVWHPLISFFCVEHFFDDLSYDPIASDLSREFLINIHIT